MGKQKHHHDKLWMSASEWARLYGGKTANTPASQATSGNIRRLPFNYCTISFLPFDIPLCAPDGYVFDIMNIVPFLKKYGVHPVTGNALEAQQLIKLKFHKNDKGEFHCPVLFKVFNESSHIVAIRTTGNVFSYDAVQTLNMKTNNLRDLLTDVPFTRQDIITLQDPLKMEKANPAHFYHLKSKLTAVTSATASDSSSTSNLGAAVSTEARHALEALKRDYKPPTDPSLYTSVGWNKFADVATDELNKSNFSVGKVAASFTSTTMNPVTHDAFARIDDDKLRYARLLAGKKKAYVQLVTSLGPLNFELHADQCPKTCENFVKHCRSGYYNDTIFHRLIRNFIVQGGDPTGTGTGGQSAFGEKGEPFADEILAHLRHEGRGMLSMANSGPNTNKSQFFITFRSAKHLDGKHTVFGRLVGGVETLDTIEYVKVDKFDRPEKEVRLLTTKVHVDPYAEVDEQLQNERLKLKSSKNEKEKQDFIINDPAPVSLFSSSVDAARNNSTAVAKYLQNATKRPLDTVLGDVTPRVAAAASAATNTSAVTTTAAGSIETQLKRKKLAHNAAVAATAGGSFGNFANW